MHKQRVILNLSAESEDLAIDTLIDNSGGATPEDSLLNQIKNAEQQKVLDEKTTPPENNVPDDNTDDGNNSGDDKNTDNQTDPNAVINPNTQENTEDTTATECDCETVESSLGMEGLIEISDCIRRLDIHGQQELVAMEAYCDAVKIGFQLSKIQANGGLNNVSASIYKNQLKTLADRVGDETLANSIKNVAAFESYSSREHLTAIALEGIKDFASRIWLAITRAIKRSIQWLQDFYNKVFDQLTKAKESIKKLRVSLGKVTKDTTDKMYTNVASIRRLISDENRPDPKENMTILMQFLVKLATPLNGANEASFKALGTMIDQAKNGEVRVPGHIFDWYGIPNLSMFDSNAGSGYMSRDRNMTVHAYRHVLPGNIRAILMRPDESVNDITQINIALKQSKLFLGAAEMPVLSISEIPLLNKAEVKPYLDQLSSLVESSMNFRSIMQNMQKQKTQIESLVNQYVKKHIMDPAKANAAAAAYAGYTGSKAKKQTSIDPSSHLFSDSVMSLIRYIDGVYIDGLSKITQLNINFINHSLQYVTNSLSALV